MAHTRHGLDRKSGHSRVQRRPGVRSPETAHRRRPPRRRRSRRAGTPGPACRLHRVPLHPLHTPVTLVSASAVRVPGTLLAHLAHVAVGTSINIIGQGRGWPPGLPVKSLDGAQIGHGQTDIIIGVTGTTAGKNYAVAGVKITYQYQGTTYRVVAWSAGIACVSRIVRSTRSCDTADQVIVPEVQKMAGAAP